MSSSPESVNLAVRRTCTLNEDNVVLFLGTERGLAVLQKLVREKIGTIVGVCVQDSEGHGAEATSEIHRIAEEIGAETYWERELKPDDYADFIRGRNAVTALCVNWRRLFSHEAVYASTRGLVVAHDSLLPHLRGFAPLNHAIRNGETETGITLFFANEQTDAGDVIAQGKTQLGPKEYVGEVRDRVTRLTVDLIAEALPKVLAGEIEGSPQDESKATYGVRLTPDDGHIDFSKGSRQIFDLIRATSHPYPGAYAHIKGSDKKLRIWNASLPEDAPRVAGAIPGRVVQTIQGRGVFVCTGDGVILLETIQSEKGEIREADQVIKRYSTTLY